MGERWNFVAVAERAWECLGLLKASVQRRCGRSFVCYGRLEQCWTLELEDSVDNILYFAKSSYSRFVAISISRRIAGKCFKIVFSLRASRKLPTPYVNALFVNRLEKIRIELSGIKHYFTRECSIIVDA